jgi:hypothetical protein
VGARVSGGAAGEAAALLMMGTLVAASVNAAIRRPAKH